MKIEPINYLTQSCRDGNKRFWVIETNGHLLAVTDLNNNVIRFNRNISIIEKYFKIIEE